MHYYTFRIGDYHSHTSHLDEMEDLAYRRMLDWVYLHESPLPDSVDQIARLIRMRTHSDSIANVLREFFELTEYGYENHAATKQIEAYQLKSEKAKQSAMKRWSAKPNKSHANALRAQSEGNANHKPITNNQEPLTNGKKHMDDKSSVNVIEQEFESVWKAYPKREGGNPKNKALIAYKARRKTHSVDEILQGVNRYAQYCQLKGMVNTPYVKQAVSFLGPDNHFLETWEIGNAEYQSNRKLSAVERVQQANLRRAQERAALQNGNRGDVNQGGVTLGADDGVVWEQVD